LFLGELNATEEAIIKLRFFVDTIKNRKEDKLVEKAVNLNAVDNSLEEENKEDDGALRDEVKPVKTMKQHIRASFNTFLKNVAYKDGWFKFQVHPTDTLIRVKGISEKESVVAYLTNLIAELISSYLFNKKTVYSYVNERNETEEIELLMVKGRFIYYNNIYFIYYIFYLIKK
jgi:hypothetical protein